MTRGLVLVADGVTATHVEYAYLRLREDAVLVDVATPGGGPVALGSRPTREALAVGELPPARRYDLMVVPGGDGSARLADDAATRRLLEAHLDAGGIVCAIDEGVGLLLEIGAMDGRLAAGPDSLQADLVGAGARLTGEAVTVDGPLVTVRDTEALPFGLAAALDSVVIPQDAAAEASDRPRWEALDST